MVSFNTNIAEPLGAFFTNPIIMSCLISWFFSQFIKGTVLLYRTRKKGLREVIKTFFWRTGGMPSTHAAVVSSMTASVAMNEGPGSNLFAVSLFMALVVMRDAMGVRHAVGLQAHALNLLGKMSEEKQGIEFRPVQEIKGHAPKEVIAGGFLGILVSVVFVFL